MLRTLLDFAEPQSIPPWFEHAVEGLSEVQGCEDHQISSRMLIGAEVSEFVDHTAKDRSPAATNTLVSPLDTAPSCLSVFEDWLVTNLETTTLYVNCTLRNCTLRKGHISARVKGIRIDMKFAALICFLLGAILLVSGAHPVAERLQQHQISYPESQRSSSINRYNSPAPFS